MKHFTTTFLSILIAFSAMAWKPVLVGHRGSILGVENTKDAFINGVEQNGYEGLECDVRVTKDGVYVISHDETTTRLGGTLTVADATYDELLAENYTQTRNSVTYTGKICTVTEFLDICVSKNVFPVIELKWTTGINNNDMSNFAGLMALVKEKGLEQKVVFLTSMQNSLLHIRTNYPDVKCQFLCNSLASSKIDWCKDNGLEPSISVGYFDQQLILKYHNAGMNVACWTVDSKANYTKYANMGIYMITTNQLKKSEMPEIEEIDWDNIPVTPDPLDITLTKVWSRTLAEGNLPENFPDGTNATYKTGQQAAIRDGKFIVSDYGTAKLLTLDKDCTEPTISDGYPMHGITTDDANNLIQRGETGYTAMPSVVYITKYGETSPVKIEFTLPSDATGQTNFIAANGDVFSSEGGYVYIYPNKQKTVYAVLIAEGKFQEVITYSGLSIEASTAGIIIPYSADDSSKFLYMVRNQGFYRHDNGDKGAILTGSSTTAPARNSSLGGEFFVLDGHEVLIHPSGKNYCGGFSIKDVTADNANLATVDALGAPDNAYGSNPSVGSFFKAESIDEHTYDLYFYTMGLGYGLYRISTTTSSINEISADGKDNFVFPNPFTSDLNIKSNNPIHAVEIYSIAGTKVWSSSANGSLYYNANLGHLGSGIYFIRINNRDVHKIIKK